MRVVAATQNSLYHTHENVEDEVIPQSERYNATYYGYAAVTNARFASLHGLTVGPFSLSTTPVSLRKPRARHERKCYNAAKAAGFRLRLGGGRYAPAAFR